MYLELDSSLLDAARAACIALPAAGLPVALKRLSGRGWALVAPLSIVTVAVAVTAFAAGAQVLTWLSLLLVPPGCALALGWAMRFARPSLALLTVPALAVALAAPDDPAGQVARIVLIGGSCVTVGRLLAGAAPAALVKAGVVAMAIVDSIVIFGHLFDQQNAQFSGAVPAPGLPQLQIAVLGHASTDYGDFFVAGLVGGVLAAERRRQLVPAIATFVAAQAFNQLFLVTDSLPATVPPALVMLAADAWRRGRRDDEGGRPAVGTASRPAKFAA